DARIFHIHRIQHFMNGRRALSFVIRAAALLSMSFAAAFGFLAAITNPHLRYNPHAFAIGTAALFGAACGGLGLLVSSLRPARRELRALRRCVEELSDLSGSSRRPRSARAACLAPRVISSSDATAKTGS